MRDILEKLTTLVEASEEEEFEFRRRREQEMKAKSAAPAPAAPATTRSVPTGGNVKYIATPDKYAGETPEQNAARLAALNAKAEADGTKARIQQDYKDQMANGLYAQPNGQPTPSKYPGLIPVPRDKEGAYMDPKTGMISYPDSNAKSTAQPSPVKESTGVTFKTDDSLARIISLVRGK